MYVLIIMMSGAMANPPPVAAHTHEFTTKAACEKAASTVKTEASKALPRVRIAAFCVPK